MTKKLLDDCFLHDAERMRHEDAVNLLRTRLAPVAGTETVSLAQAAGRFLAEPIVAPHDIPAHTNAAVDGYAFAYGDYDRDQGTAFRLSARAAAGHPVTETVPPETAIRIFTGAQIPAGLDTVVMQEDCETEERADGRWVKVPAGLKPAANCRLAGEDVKAGTVVLGNGKRLRPQDLATGASAGAASLLCYERLSVGLVSTGDEIIQPGETLSPGQVYDANAPMLQALIGLSGAVAHNLGVLPDDASIVAEKLKAAAAEHQVLITSGGASRGEEDHVVKTLDTLGKLHMWQIAVKPGRPMAFGQIADCAFVGLPGNPVAVFVCFLLYVYPMLLRLGGGDWLEPRRFAVKSAFSIPSKKPGRREFLRGTLTTNTAGETVVTKYPSEGSGLISSLRASDGLIEIGEDVTAIAEGDLVDFIPYSEFGIVGGSGPTNISGAEPSPAKQSSRP